MEDLPKVIFFDAVGTLFGVKGSVGEIYSKIAQSHGVFLDSDLINSAFYKVFSNSSPLAFGKIDPTKISQAEFDWWKEIAILTFSQAKALDKFTDFDGFFQELYDYFATEKPWYIYADVVETLKLWQQKKVDLGIISNFDTRIYSVLKLLQLERFFSSVTISSEVGFAKPHPTIFKTAIAKHKCLPEETWHIGDSFDEDYQGGKQLKIKTFWLTRKEKNPIEENQLPNLISLG